MTTLYSWSAKRAGGRITIYHSCGKVPHIDLIEPTADGIIATASDMRRYLLSPVAPESE